MMQRSGVSTTRKAQCTAGFRIVLRGFEQGGQFVGN